MKDPCNLCRGQGLVFLKYQTEPGYDVGVCICEAGKWYRTAWQLRAWVDRQGDHGPEYFGWLEDFYTPAELKTLVTVEGESLEEFSRTSVPAMGARSAAGSKIGHKRG